MLCHEVVSVGWWKLLCGHLLDLIAGKRKYILKEIGRLSFKPDISLALKVELLCVLKGSATW